MARTGDDVPAGRGVQAADERVEKRKRLEIRKRPAWWQPFEKGSHRTVLSLRPADALPGAVPGKFFFFFFSDVRLFSFFLFKGFGACIFFSRLS